MKPLIMVMLAAQVVIFLVAAYTVMFGRSTAARGRPIWSSLAITLIIVAGTSWNIGEKHAGQPGADILMYGSPLLLGMGIMAAFVLLRKRRGLDSDS